MDIRDNKRRLLKGQNTNSSNASRNPSSPSPQPASKSNIKHTGSLEIIEGDPSGLYSPVCGSSENDSRPSSQAFQRPWSRSSMGSVPPRPDSSLSRRLATPTKQVTLQAVKRKEESSEPFKIDVDFHTLNLDTSYNRAWNLSSLADEDSSRIPTPTFNDGSDLHALQHATQLRLPSNNSSHSSRHKEEEERKQPLSSNGARAQAGGSQEAESGREVSNVAASAEDSGDDEDREGDESSEEEERVAPNELLMEFVECLMKKDYKNADKLCKMILLYEPGNPEALKFQPVIEEKLRLDAEAEAGDQEEDDGEDDDGEDDDDDDDEDDDDGDSSSDDDDDDDDTDSDDSDDDDENEESVFRIMAEAVASNYYQAQEPAGDPRLPRRPDSGIS